MDSSIPCPCFCPHSDPKRVYDFNLELVSSHLSPVAFKFKPLFRLSERLRFPSSLSTQKPNCFLTNEAQTLSHSAAWAADTTCRALCVCLQPGHFVPLFLVTLPSPCSRHAARGAHSEGFAKAASCALGPMNF